MFIDESKFIDILDEVLESIFSDAIKNLLYDFFERNYSLSIFQILQNTSLFIEALVSTFGETGAKMIEYEILRAVGAKISYDGDKIRLTLSQIDEYSYRLRSCVDFLSGYEAKLYIALVSHGESPARKLTKITEIPRSKIYITAKGLQSKDMISIRLFKELTIFKPKNPKKIFSDHIELMRKKLLNFEQIVKELNELYQSLSLPEELDSLEQLKSTKSTSKRIQ